MSLCKTVAFTLLGISEILSSELNLIGYDVIPPTTQIGEVNHTTPVWEISGLSHNHNAESPIFYGISDSIFNDFPKRIFSFSLETVNNKPSLMEDNIDGVEMEDPSNYPLFTADTESIVYLEDTAGDIFFIVSTEGYRQFGTFTNFWLYDDTGGFLGNLSYSDDIFQEQGTYEDPTYGFEDGEGIESMSVTSDYSTVIFIGSLALVQDDCTSCLRISVNTMDYSGDIPTWTETVQYIYNADDEDTRVTDVAIVTNDLGSVIILERRYTNITDSFINKAYEISLKDIDTSYDVKGCRTYDSSCAAFGNVLSKTLLRDIGDFTDIPNIADSEFEAIAAGVGYSYEGCDGHFMMAVTDNDEVLDTVFAYLCFIPDGVTTETPTDTTEEVAATTEEVIVSTVAAEDGSASFSIMMCCAVLVISVLY